MTVGLRVTRIHLFQFRNPNRHLKIYINDLKPPEVLICSFASQKEKKIKEKEKGTLYEWKAFRELYALRGVLWTPQLTLLVFLELLSREYHCFMFIVMKGINTLFCSFGGFYHLTKVWGMFTFGHPRSESIILGTKWALLALFWSSGQPSIGLEVFVSREVGWRWWHFAQASFQ